MVTRTLVNCAKRVPLIKFRKGGAPTLPSGGNVQAAGATAATANQATAPAIEDWQLPARYWRKPIDATEMAYINNGGIP